MTCIKINGIVYTVAIAKTNEEKEKGLMFINELSERTGMIFIEPYPTKFSVWMKNTYISLDILFIDKNNVVCDLIPNNKPFDLTIKQSKCNCLYMIELPSGHINKYNIQIGQPFQFC